MGSNVNLEEYAIKFLLYSYFRLSLDSGTKEILNSIIERAYKDATMQGAYNAKLSDDEKNNIPKQSAIDEVTKRLASLREVKDKISYDSWHDKLCSALTTQFNNDKFTYGNAQKWVNMTMKYMLIIHGIFKNYAKNDEFENDYGEILDILLKYLHVPIDSYIAESIRLSGSSVKLPFSSHGAFTVMSFNGSISTAQNMPLRNSDIELISPCILCPAPPIQDLHRYIN